jgi:hypothetical protein
MCIPERQPLAHQVICQVGGSGKTLQGRLAHLFPVGPDVRRHVSESPQAVLKLVGAVEQGLLVFLIVLVIGQGLAFHEHEQADEVAGDPAGLAPHQFGHIRVLFLRHDG